MFCGKVVDVVLGSGVSISYQSLSVTCVTHLASSASTVTTSADPLSQRGQGGFPACLLSLCAAHADRRTLSFSWRELRSSDGVSFKFMEVEVSSGARTIPYLSSLSINCLTIKSF